jgi:hypothetical protein
MQTLPAMQEDGPVEALPCINYEKEHQVTYWKIQQRQACFETRQLGTDCSEDLGLTIERSSHRPE